MDVDNQTSRRAGTSQMSSRLRVIEQQARDEATLERWGIADDLRLLANRMEIEVLDLDRDSVVLRSDQSAEIAGTLHVTLTLGEGAEAIQSHEAFPVVLRGQLMAGDDLRIDRADVDLRSWYG